MQYQTAEPNYSNIIMNSSSNIGGGGGEVERVIERMAGESAVVIFSVSSCCMCHAIKRLLCGMGVNPTVHELDLLPAGHLLHSALLRFAAGPSSSSSPSPSISQLPLVFVGGKLLGAMDRVMASHINGTLVPLLKDAGALWL